MKDHSYDEQESLGCDGTATGDVNARNANGRSFQAATRIDADLTTPSGHAERGRLPFQKLGEYELICELGRGGMGVVYKAHERKLNRDVALKILPPFSVPNRTQVDRFELEAKAAASLNHDHIVPVYHIGEEDGTRYFAMKLIDGDPLSVVVRSARLAVQSSSKSRPKGSSTTVRTRAERTDKHDLQIDLSSDYFLASATEGTPKSTMKLAKLVALIGVQTAQALHHAHERGVVHRDIKPSNLIIDKQQKVWVTDFGLAQLQSSPALTQTGDIVGTLRYMSPEQASGRRNFVDNRTDIYSTGITLYELLTLRPACRGKTVPEVLREITFELPTPLRKLNPGIPRDLETIIQRAIERNPNDRYPNAQALAEDLQRFLNGKRLNTKRFSAWKRTRDWLYERPVVSGVIGIGGLSMLCVLVMGALLLGAMLQVERKENRAFKAAYSDLLNGKLVAEANLQLPTNPGLALALAREAREAPRQTLNPTLLKILEEHQEETLIAPVFPEEGQLTLAGSNSPLVLKSFWGSAWGKRRPALIYDLTTGEEVARLSASKTISSATFHPSLPLLLTAGSNYQVRGQPQNEPDLEFSPIDVWGLQDFVLNRSLAAFHSIELTAQAFTPRQERVVLPTGADRATFISLEDYSEIGPALVGHTGKVLQAVVSPDGKYVATWSMDGTVRIWDAETGNELAKYPLQTRRLADVRLRFSENSQYLMAQGSGIYIVNVQVLENDPVHLSGDLAAFVPGTSRILFVPKSSFSNTVREFDLDALEYRATYEGADRVLKIDVTANGRYLGMACYDHVAIFDLRSQELVSEAKGHEGWISDLHMLPNGTQFCTTGIDGTTRLWRNLSDQATRTFDPTRDLFDIPRISWKSDGSEVLISSTYNLETVFYDVQDLSQEPVAIRGIADLVLSDGRVITREDSLVTLWSARKSVNGVFDLGLDGQPDLIREIPQSNQVLITNLRGELLLWDLKSLDVSPVTTESAAYYLHRDDANQCVWISFADRWLGKWEAGQEKFTRVSQFAHPIRSIDSSLDGKRLLLHLGNGQVLTWNCESLQSEWQRPDQNAVTDESQQRSVTHAAFLDRSGSMVCITTEDSTSLGRVEIWNTSDEALVDNSEHSRIMEVQADPRQEAIVVVDGVRGISIWNSESRVWKKITELPGWTARFSEGFVVFATTSGDSLSSILANAAAEKMVTPILGIWDIAAQSLKQKTDLPLKVIQLFIGKDGKQIILGGLNHGAEWWRLDQDVQTHIGKHASKLLLADFLDDQSCITVAVDGTWMTEDMAGSTRGPSGQDADRLPHEYPLESAILTPDKRFLVTTDQIGHTFKTDIATGSSERVELEFEEHTKHVLFDDGFSVLSCDSSDRILRWDLRSSNSADEFSFGHPIFDIDLAKTRPQALLLRGQRRPIAIPAKLFGAPNPKNPPTEPDAWLWNFSRDERAPITVEGDLIDGRFSADEKSLYLLNTEGTITILSVDDLQATGSFSANTRIQYLLDSDEPDMVFAASDRQVWGFNPLSGELTWEFSATISTQDLSPSNEQTAADDWQITGQNSGWMVAPTEDGFLKIPIDLPAYVEQKGVRELTEDEERRFIAETPLAGISVESD
ncbi:MAG: serine/threonine-protein kinase [bacterium]|nr:serine/threonine-protein kinase [bacterium]